MSLSQPLTMLISVLIVSSTYNAAMDAISSKSSEVNSAFDTIRDLRAAQDYQIQQYAKVLNVDPSTFYPEQRMTEQEIDQAQSKLNHYFSESQEAELDMDAESVDFVLAYLQQAEDESREVTTQEVRQLLQSISD